MKHQFNHMYRCEVCGAGLLDVRMGERSEECSAGVVGISHLVRGRVIEALCDSVTRKLQGQSNV